MLFFASRAIGTNWALSLPTFVTSCATIKFVSVSTVGLYIVANKPRAFAARSHGTSIGVGQGYLAIGRIQ